MKLALVFGDNCFEDETLRIEAVTYWSR